MSTRYTKEENADGSVIVKLASPVKFAGESVSRLTIPALTGRHMRACPWKIGVRVSVGEAIDFASQLVEPKGIVDELPAWLARDIGLEVLEVLGKEIDPPGEASSPSSGG